METKGALIPGNRNVGVVKHNNKFYVFSCMQGVLEFVKNPDKYVIIPSTHTLQQIAIILSGITDFYLDMFTVPWNSQGKSPI